MSGKGRGRKRTKKSEENDDTDGPSTTKKSLQGVGQVPLELEESNANDMKLGKDFFNQECLTLCRALLGQVLVRRLPNGAILKGVITETEAYPGGPDAASQSFNGRRTERSEPMYMDPATSYVYFTYGTYHCFNISSMGEGSAVLIRGLDPLENYQFMHNQRTTMKKSAETNPLKIWELCNGPGKLCLSMDIRRDNCNKLDMSTSNELYLERNPNEQQFEIDTSPRIGIDKTPKEARNQPWRFFIIDNFSVSKAKVSEIRKRLAASQSQDNTQD